MIFCLFAALVNKLWKRMDKLESEKRNLQIKLDQPISEPPSPRSKFFLHLIYSSVEDIRYSVFIPRVLCR
jgi:hypothetical protein